MWRCGRAVAGVVFLVTLFSLAARADINSGAQWLGSAAQSNGSYAQPNDVATPFQSTAEALRTFNTLAINAGGAPAALQFLAGEPYQNTENLSRLIIAGSQGGQNVSALVTQLLANQDGSSGGFGELPGYQPTVLDTGFALEALAISGNLNSQAAAGGVGFLQQQQASDGSWTDGDNAPSVYLTALSLASLNDYKSLYNLTATLQAGSGYLLSARQGDGLWGQDFLGGLSLISLLQTLADTTTLQGGISSLQAHQAADGSWGDDAYTTAVALRALGLAQARGAGTANGTGAVQGYVTQAGSSQPIAGAVVAVSSIQGLSAQTNADGFFTLSGLPTGNLTLVANKAGFSSASAVVTVIAGKTATASGLVLAPGAQSGTMRVHLVDSASGAALAGAGVSISGSGGSSSGNSDNQGNVEFDGLTPGAYAITIQASGYQTVQGTVSVAGGQILTVNEPLQSSTSISNSGAASLSGSVVDAATNAPVSGAVFALTNGPSATTAANGGFSVGGVNGGSYTARVTAAGYASQTLSIIVPAGASASLGTISLYQANNSAAPNTVTLVGTVIDGVSNKPVSGVAVTLSAGGSTLSATSDGQGQFTIANIAALSFQVQLAASGYTTGSYSATASAYGSVSGTFTLSPVGSGGNAVNLQGHVTDATSGAAIGGATVQVPGSSISTQTDASGAYQLQNLPNLQFSVQVSALNYATQTLNLKLTGPGSYTLDVQLNGAQSASSGFQVLSLSTGDSGKGANQTQIFTAQVGNQSASSQEGILIGRILDASGNQVATTTPYAPNTQTAQSDFTFNPQEVKTLQIPWNPAQLPPGTYTLELDVVKPGTISRQNPTGTILAENAAFTSVSATQSFIGTLAFNPPAAQAGSSAPVTLEVLVINSGNVPLSGTPLTLNILSADGSSVADTATANLSQPLPVGQFVYVPFGSWVPSVSGNLPVNVASSGAVQGQITGTLYVGDKPQGSFTVTPGDVFTGTQTVHATVDVTGVDKAISVDSPLVTAIRNAIQKGIPYVATNVVNDQVSSRCLRCHVQSQSYYGLASLLGHDVGSDPTTTQFVYNAIATSQQDDGSLHSAYVQYAETQTALELWALTQAQDKLGSFRTKYRAAQYMQSRASTSGSSTYWNPDYGSGWWANTDTHTMMAVKGFVDLLQTAQNNSLSGLLDYAASSPVASLGGNANGIRVGPDGALYAVLYANGSIVRYDTAKGTVSTVATGLPVNSPTFCSSPLVVSPSEFYVPCQSQLIHVLPDGTQQQVLALGGRGGDIAIDANGTIYVSDMANNQILRSVSGGTFSVFASGGLLNAPFGLAVGPDGLLYVANYGGFNLLKVALDGSVSTFADALSYPPLYLAAQADGSLFVSHPSYYDGTSGQTTTDGVMLISPQGVGSRLFSDAGVRGVVLNNGQLYLAGTDGNLRTLQTKALDTSQLSGLSSQVTGAVHYFLNEYNDGNGNNIYQAVRLIGLAEARRVTTDAGLLGQIDAATSAINTLLRSRQNSDGGWGLNPGWGSDAIVTALVGTALDYLSPPNNDPVVLNTVQYLLNTQAADGSWSSANGLMSTRFASTSLVMAYLPRVLDLLGGISVELHLNFPANITLANPSLPPSGNLPTSDGGTAYTWQLPGVTSQGRALTFDLTLASLQTNETRAAASAAYMLSTNSFNSSQLHVDLQIPNVHASDGLTLVSVAADKTSYVANDTAQITAQVDNVAPASQSGTVVFTIKAADGSVVAVLPAVPFSGLAANTAAPVTTGWSVGNTLAGTYPVVADLYDSSGKLADEKTTALAVVVSGGGTGNGGGGGPNTQVTLRVTTDKPSYSTTDQVNIGDLVQNISANGLVASASLQLTLLDPSGATVYTVTVPLGQLTPGYLRQLSNLYPLKAAPQGSYTVNGAVLDGSGAVLAMGSAGFKVVEDPSRTIVGSEKVQSASVYQGDPQVCTDGVSDRGTLAASNLPVQQLIINLDTGSIEQRASNTANLAAGATQSYVRNFTTGSLPIGNHACAIQAQINGAYKTLASAAFQVKQPPVRVTGSLGLGDKGRLLVLVDSKHCHHDGDGWGHDDYSRTVGLLGNNRMDGGDRHGDGGHDCDDDDDGDRGDSRHQRVPLDQQISVLKALLNQDGWSYDLSNNTEDFVEKFRGGGYQTYALLARHPSSDDRHDGWDDLDGWDGDDGHEPVQRELREHVFSGEGLLLATPSASQQQTLDQALGVKEEGFGGDWCDANGLLMLPNNPYSLSGQASFTQGDKARRIDLQGATADARRLGQQGWGDDTSVFTHYGYGNGKSAYAGFGLLAEAAGESTPGLFSGLIRRPLLYVNPSQASPLAGRVVPLHLTVTNTGIDNTTQVAVATTLNSYVVAASAGTVANGKLSWSFGLPAKQTQSVDLWVSLPSDGSPVTVTATLVASTPSFTANPVTLTQTLTPVVKPGLSKAIADLGAYVASQPKPKPHWGDDGKTAAARALDELNEAQTDLGNGNAKAALHELLDATDDLIQDGSAAITPIRLEVDEAVEQTEKLL